jgi:hypothetical protein
MRRVPFEEIVPAKRAIVGLAYVAGYVALDRISFIEPYAFFGITPWNPNTGLSIVLVLFFDIWMVPLLFVAPFMADLINRQINLPWVVEFISVALIGGGYSTALAFLKSSRIRFDPGLSSTRDLLLLMLVAAASAAFVASTYVGVAIAAGLLSIKDFAPATLRYWIGGRSWHPSTHALCTVRFDRPKNRAEWLNPLPPNLYHWYHALALYSGHDYEQAVKVLKQMRSPDRWSHCLLAACYAQTGQLDEARSELEIFISEREHELKERGETPPRNRLELALSRAERYRNPSDREHFLDGLRKAGLKG